MALPAILATVLGPIFGNVLDRIIPDPNARAKATEELTKAIASADLRELEGQLKLNELAAQSQSLFIAGARPFLLWGVGIGLLYSIILYPYVIWAAKLYGLPAPPALDSEMLFSLVTGMLGLAGLRSFDKVKGVARK